MKVIEVNENNFNDEVLNSKQKVLVDFNASWCGPCRMLRPTLEELAGENDYYKIVSVNVDNNEDLARKYGVMSIPCLILIENGQEVRRNVGLISKERVKEFIGE